ncbi:TPA: hypothetical protein NU718_000381 [Acinetobacter baumannii]|nr:hypothetical protein [Acinetobacter baumannii]
MFPDAMNEDIRNKTTLIVQKIYEQQNTPSVKRKNLELEIVRLIQSYITNGLDIETILIDLSKDGINASVYLNETTNTQAETTGAENTKAE